MRGWPKDSPPAQATQAGAPVSAASVLRMLAPRCSAAVFGRLVRERVRTAVDLASLDKDDLRALGLTMVERGRVVRWAREAFPAGGAAAVSPDTSPGTPGYGFGVELCARAHDYATPSQAPSECADEDSDLHMEDIETQADFWCSLVTSSTPVQQRRRAEVQGMLDVRENVLEERFDVTSERVAEVYNDMLRQSLDRNGRISVQELGHGLRRCGLVGLDDSALAQVIETVRPHRSGGLKLAEFETVLSRLKLAQLFVCPLPASPSEDSNLLDSPTAHECPLRPSDSATSSTNVRLTVVDYNAHRYSTTEITDASFREFCFGHRSRCREPHEQPLVRWVHFADFDLTTLLCLTVKYSLHPLGVEDVIEQCPTKIDRYGCNYFAAVEQLCLVGGEGPPPGFGMAPVRVAGFHVAAFCSGPPLFDTVITVAQPDRSFASDWPGGADWSGASGHCWAEKLRLRLTSAPRSRLRERRADFLLYHILDISTDELQAVIRAYTARLVKLDQEALHGRGHCDAHEGNASDPCCEASTSRLQLKVIMRRVRGLQRMLRHFASDADFTADLSGYLQDVAEHLDEAYEDTAQLVEKCTGILEVHQRSIERRDEKVHQRTAARLNKTLFVLTVGTFVFAPLQFLAAVYGMNFVNKAGVPSIPELLMPHGYAMFWLGTLSYLLVMSVFIAWWFFRIHRRSAEDASADLDV